MFEEDDSDRQVRYVNAYDPGRAIEALVRWRDFSRNSQRRRRGWALADGHDLYQRREIERRRYPGGNRLSTQHAGRWRADPRSAGPPQPAGRCDVGAGMLPSGKPVIAGNITAPPKGPTFAFGEYILSYQDCPNAMAVV